MADQPQKPPLQKPPGYRDPTAAPGKPAMSRPPPRKSVLPTTFHHKKRRRNWCRTCCCFIFVFLLLLIFVLAIAGGLFYLWFDPKLPVFHLQSFRVPKFNVTVKSDGTYLDAHTVTRIEVKNPNSKLEIFYGRTQVSVTAGGDDTEFGSQQVSGFTQGKKNTTSLKIETAVKNQLVDDGLGTKLKNGFKNKGLVVDVEARTRVGFIVQGMKIGTVEVDALCGGVSLKKLDSGDMPKCSVNLFKWINLHY
ncbi:NDR1/HIN1-like protein 6 [Humulus lupulus]|uniref:NDR1/HIN1-like protein 6 n=1 Tax=Humulus lupulus TaxID=3486 RepID=UPI002B4104EB|nr:NDR1/HIN1-like protein 6 [Humulus lupulus]